MASVSGNMTWNGPEIEGLTVAASRAGVTAAAVELQKQIMLNLGRPGAPTSETGLKHLTGAFRNLGFALAAKTIGGKNFSVIRGALFPFKGPRRILRGKDVVRAEGDAKRLMKEPSAEDNIFVDPAGGMPRKRSGQLRLSIQVAEEKDSVLVGSNSVYGAIHEFGGMAGRGRKVHIPARPYIKPSLNQAGPAMFEAFMANAKRVMGGGT